MSIKCTTNNCSLGCNPVKVNEEKEMQLTKYKVWFSTENYKPEFVSVFASNQDNAVILAKAKRIQKRLDHTLFKIETS
jgi:hypothetical protein